MPPLPAVFARVAQRRRQVWADGERAHVEHREVPPQLQAAFEAVARAELDDLLGVGSVRFLLRPPWVVVGYDPSWTTPEELSDAVDRAETVLGELTIPLTRPSHPGDREPVVRLLTQLGLHAATIARRPTATWSTTPDGRWRRRWPRSRQGW